MVGSPLQHPIYEYSQSPCQFSKCTKSVHLLIDSQSRYCSLVKEQSSLHTQHVNREPFILKSLKRSWCQIPIRPSWSHVTPVNAMRAVRSFVRSVRAAATEDIQTTFTSLIAAEAAAERERTVWISRPHTRGQIIVLFSQITSVSSKSEYKIQDSSSFSGALNAAPTR
jgi:hypothetical protein